MRFLNSSILGKRTIETTTKLMLQLLSFNRGAENHSCHWIVARQNPESTMEAVISRALCKGRSA